MMAGVRVACNCRLFAVADVSIQVKEAIVEQHYPPVKETRD